MWLCADIVGFIVARSAGWLLTNVSAPAEARAKRGKAEAEERIIRSRESIKARSASFEGL